MVAAEVMVLPEIPAATMVMATAAQAVSVVVLRVLTGLVVIQEPATTDILPLGRMELSLMPHTVQEVVVAAVAEVQGAVELVHPAAKAGFMVRAAVVVVVEVTVVPAQAVVVEGVVMAVIDL